MVPLANVKAGDCLWVEHHGKHPAVVITVRPGVVVVIVGTSRSRDAKKELVITEREPAGRALGLDHATHFYSERIAIIVDPKEIYSATGKKCPPSAFNALEQLALQASINWKPKPVTPVTLPAKQPATVVEAPVDPATEAAAAAPPDAKE